MRRGKGCLARASLWVTIALLVASLVLACNVWRQWSYCGTPLARCSPAQVEPCERVADIQAEWARLEALAREFPESDAHITEGRDAKN